LLHHAVFCLYTSILEEHTIFILRVKYGNSTFLQNTSTQLNDYTVKQPRRPPSVLISL
jgi:hypothetical protein